MDNTRIWDKLAKTDPAHTKSFKRAGGFSGTAIKPIYSIKRMTDHFGPCGYGWGMTEPTFTVVPAGNETLVYATVGVWVREGDNQSAPIYGVGGDKVMTVRKDGGAFCDDEAFKKAYTDALTNALVKLGVGADVHMGLFEDNKYLAAVRDEFEALESAPIWANPTQRKTYSTEIQRFWGANDPVGIRQLWDELNNDQRQDVWSDFNTKQRTEIKALLAQTAPKGEAA